MKKYLLKLDRLMGGRLMDCVGKVLYPVRHRAVRKRLLKKVNFFDMCVRKEIGYRYFRMPADAQMRFNRDYLWGGDESGAVEWLLSREKYRDRIIKQYTPYIETVIAESSRADAIYEVGSGDCMALKEIYSRVKDVVIVGVEMSRKTVELVRAELPFELLEECADRIPNFNTHGDYIVCEFGTVQCMHPVEVKETFKKFFDDEKCRGLVLSSAQERTGSHDYSTVPEGFYYKHNHRKILQEMGFDVQFIELDGHFPITVARK